jgi:hypothetical protein
MDLRKYHKYGTIYHWKQYGLIHDDIDMLYKEYINTFNCNHCHKEFKNTRERHLDHCHITGKFRKIVCHACNTNDNYINYPDGVPSKYERNKIYHEKHKEYYEENKDKIKEYQEKNKDKLNQKIDCDCGGKYTFQNKQQHYKTKKHLSYKQRLGL